jgi:hypothetical protein
MSVSNCSLKIGIADGVHVNSNHTRRTTTCTHRGSRSFACAQGSSNVPALFVVFMSSAASLCHSDSTHTPIYEEGCYEVLMHA